MKWQNTNLELACLWTRAASWATPGAALMSPAAAENTDEGLDGNHVGWTVQKLLLAWRISPFSDPTSRQVTSYSRFVVAFPRWISKLLRTSPRVQHAPSSRSFPSIRVNFSVATPTTYGGKYIVACPPGKPSLKSIPACTHGHAWVGISPGRRRDVTFGEVNLESARPNNHAHVTHHTAHWHFAIGQFVTLLKS